MKKLIVILTTVLFFSGYTANAQMMGQNYNQNQQWGMMMNRGGMMQGMMGNGMYSMNGQMMGQNMPMWRYGMMINRLPDMQQQLSLNDDQVGQLIDLQTNFKKQQIDYRAELQKQQMQLQNLLNDNASATKVKNQLEACSETRINMKLAAYENFAKMKAVLNDDQKEQIDNMMMQQGRIMQGQGGMMNQRRGRMMNNRGGMMQNWNNN